MFMLRRRIFYVYNKNDLWIKKEKKEFFSYVDYTL